MKNGDYLEAEFDQGNFCGNILVVKKNGRYFQGFIKNEQNFEGLVSLSRNVEQKDRSNPDPIILTGKNKLGYEIKKSKKLKNSRFHSKEKIEGNRYRS